MTTRSDIARSIMEIRFGSHNECFKASEATWGPIKSAPYLSANALYMTWLL
jgi:hypothetical protein